MIKCATTALSIPGKCLLCVLQTRVSDMSRGGLGKSLLGLRFHPGVGVGMDEWQLTIHYLSDNKCDNCPYLSSL